MENIKKNNTLQMLLIGLKLLIICAAVAGIVSFFYALTLDQYNNNIKEEKRKAIIQIFGSDTLTYEQDESQSVYTVSENGTVIGYCVETASAGFGGDIEMMVGYREDGSILGVSIISLSETPGLGAKVNDTAYLSQYNEKHGELELKKDIDAISGATISSRAVLAGVNKATEILNEYQAKQTGGGTQ